MCNISGGEPVALADFITAIEKAIGKQALIINLPMQPGDVNSTFADCSALEAVTAYLPQVHIEEGMKVFVKWYMNYFK